MIPPFIAEPQDSTDMPAPDNRNKIITMLMAIIVVLIVFILANYQPTL